MNIQKNKFFDLKLPELIKRLSKSHTFLINFLYLLGIMAVIFSTFAIIIFFQSKNILEQEFTASSHYKLEETAQTVDNHLKDMRYIIATLDTNSIVKAFFIYDSPTSIYNGYYDKVQEILKAYVNGFSSIDSIYLYSQRTESILTDSERMTLSHFTDVNWMNVTVDESSNIQIFFRAKEDSFPYVLSLVKHLTINGYNASIVVNVNLKNLAQLTEIQKDSYQELYLISDDSEILFYNQQRELATPVSQFPKLCHFQPDADFFSFLVNENDSSYVYTQIRSKDYPWSYVMITHLQEYTSRLSSFKATFTAILFSLFFAVLLLSFLLSMRSVKPIQNLLQLIQNPGQTLSNELYSDAEIQYIANQITTYIQQNQNLTDELSTRLNLLNQTRLLALQSQINPHFLFNTLNMIHIQESEVLGYDHKIPQLTLNLSHLLRYAIDSTDLVSLETELTFTKLYINILKERYDNKPQVIYDLDSNVFKSRVPKLFIQPLIENAVFHGLGENMNESSTLTIFCKQEVSFIVVSVRDNGIGMSQDTLETLKQSLQKSVPLQNNIGIKNVVTRMNLLYGEEFSIYIDSAPGQGSVFTLRFPLMQ